MSRRTRLLRLLSLWLVVVAAPLLACAAKPDATYQKAMQEGRTLEEHGDHAGAARAFERAVQARPGDAAALSELGWAAFGAGDLARAADATGRAIAAAGDAKLKAASLYNLGRIQEQRGETDQAAESYRQSLALRPSAAVQARLQKLAPAPPRAGAATPPGALGPRALDGPYPSLDAWCEAVKKAPRPPKKCFLDEEGKKTALERPVAPWRAAKTIQSGAFDDRQLRVAVQTPAGWFVSRPAGDSQPVVETVDIAARDVIAGGAPELVVRHIEVSATAGSAEGRWSQRCTELLTICGLGAGDRPSCTPPIAVREGGCKDTAHVEWEWALDVQLPGDGSVRVAPKTGTAPAPAKALVGTHRIELR